MSGDLPNNGRKWKWALGLLCLGVTGMTMALLVSGYEESFVERALGGSTWSSYFEAQGGIWFMQGMFWRQIFGYMTAAGLGLLIWDLLTIGRNDKRPMLKPLDGDVEATPEATEAAA